VNLAVDIRNVQIRFAELRPVVEMADEASVAA